MKWNKYSSLHKREVDKEFWCNVGVSRTRALIELLEDLGLKDTSSIRNTKRVRIDQWLDRMWECKDGY